MNKYIDGKIYKIKCNITGDVYIGSTCKTLNERISRHECNYKSYKKDNYNFVTSFKILQNNDYNIELIRLCPCDNKKELHEIEKYYIINNECINKYIPNRTRKEHYIHNKIKINEKQNFKHTCECGGRFTYSNKKRHERTIIHKCYCQSMLS